MENLENKSFAELKAIMVQRYDGNAGEIINGFMEMGLKGKALTAAMVRYINRVPAYNC
jgi:hypothetical protein